jgi:hypothetical protein
MLPVTRMLNLGSVREGMLVLDLDKVHACGAEVGDMPVDRGLTLAVVGAKVKKESSRYMGQLPGRIQQTQHDIPLIHELSPFRFWRDA